MKPGEKTTQRHGPHRSYSKIRAGVLVGVCVLMTAHLLHGLYGERTLAPLELNEVMHTLELGIVTAGFLFMLVVLISVLIFGRFFCSWGCHILALEDLAAWILEKMNILPKPIRSRLLLLVAPLALLYMFVWPQIKRLIAYLWPSTAEVIDPPPAFELRVLSDQDGWASFITNDFTRNLPGPGIAILTFIVCGFVMVYMLGSRSFCRYACPYGALFSLANRLSPGQIISRTDCTGCQLCTKTCSTGVVVHEEIDRFGRIVSPNCLKDLDCISVCSTGTLQYGFGAPSLLASASKQGRTTVSYDFSWREEALMAVLFIASFSIFRGLYSLVPFLLSLGLAACVAYAGVLATRLITQPTLHHYKTWFKTAGQIEPRGWLLAAACLLTAGICVHSGMVRYHEVMGERRFEDASRAWQETGAIPGHLLDAALAHQEARASLGILSPPDISQKQATLLQAVGRHAEAIPHFRDQLSREPANPDALLNLSKSLIATGERIESRKNLQSLISRAPSPAHLGHAHELLGTIDLSEGHGEAAVRSFTMATSQPGAPASAHMGLATALATVGRITEAIKALKDLTERQPDLAAAHYNLGRLQVQRKQLPQALASYRRALTLTPNDPETLNNLGLLLAHMNQIPEAIELLKQAILAHPNYGEPHFNLGRIYSAIGRESDADAHFKRANAINPQFVPQTPKQTH